ncbi:hypothetical protein CEJ42_17825 [Herbaspirillum robiniae]|uniref:Uncharacterized protein n=1 Tax=Herbaspirillum robiniae TaxID=2014887 RepID=A0A246WNI8_9BURK|nr:hypothetical protein CEJ42_17825 [Herbaspirillum robiniae]
MQGRRFAMQHRKGRRTRPEERHTPFFLVQNSPVLLQILFLIVDDLSLIVVDRQWHPQTGFSSRA